MTSFCNDHMSELDLIINYIYNENNEKDVQKFRQSIALLKCSFQEPLNQQQRPMKELNGTPTLKMYKAYEWYDTLNVFRHF